MIKIIPFFLLVVFVTAQNFDNGVPLPVFDENNIENSPPLRQQPIGMVPVQLPVDFSNDESVPDSAPESPRVPLPPLPPPPKPTTTQAPTTSEATTEPVELKPGSYSELYINPNGARAERVAWKAFKEDINVRLPNGNYWIPLKVMAANAQVVNGVQYELLVLGGESNCFRDSLQLSEISKDKCYYLPGNRKMLFNVLVYEKNSRWTEYSPIISRTFSLKVRDVDPNENI